MARRSEIDFSRYSDGDLIKMAEEILDARDENGEKIGTKGFQAYYKTDFDYSQATYELEKRGYAKQWVKVRNVPEAERETKGEREVIDLTCFMRVDTTRYEATFSKEFVKKLNKIPEGIKKNDRRSKAIEAALTPLIDELLRLRKMGMLVFREAKVEKRSTTHEV